MTKDEQKAIQPLLRMMRKVEEKDKHRAFTMANTKRDPYCSCLPNVDVGFNVTFPNDWEVSVRWGEGHHCDGGKTTVEVAIFDADDNWYTLDGRDEVAAAPNTDVMCYVTPEVLLIILRKVSER